MLKMGTQPPLDQSRGGFETSHGVPPIATVKDPVVLSTVTASSGAGGLEEEETNARGSSSESSIGGLCVAERTGARPVAGYVLQSQVPGMIRDCTSNLQCPDWA